MHLPHSFYRNNLKRCFDFSLSLVLLVFTLPVNLIISIILYFTNNGKVFFIQPRPGKNEKIFYIIKFRTMIEKRNAEGKLLSDNERITRFGRIMRKTSIDELPQLFNVLIGDLSLVGPRPLLVEYLPLYNDFQRKRHEVRPGITGWAQIKGRNSISWKQKFEYDYYYVEHLSFLFDIKILMLTLKKVVRSDDINSSEDLTMDTFNGNN
jgi:undecaprenyl phosphate N,N'-diacetylbacillosamine 1-phosphate transferase